MTVDIKAALRRSSIKLEENCTIIDTKHVTLLNQQPSVKAKIGGMNFEKSHS